MELFASKESEQAWLIFAIVVCFVGWFSYRAYVFFYRPEQWAAEKWMQHEKEMAAKARNGRIAGGLVGGIAKAVLGAALGGKRHN